MKNILKSLLFCLFVFGFFIKGVEASSQFRHVISLEPDWNLVSTPRLLSSHQFSASSTSANYDIYVLNPSSASKWSTMAEMGQTEFQPLFGYFINNKTGATTTLTLDYRQDTAPNERFFSNNLLTGWNAIGVASPNYALKQKDSDSLDTNNVKNIIDNLSQSTQSVYDLTANQSSKYSTKISNNWFNAVYNDANSLNDFRETKAYVVFNNSAGVYNGFQNNDAIKVCTNNGTITSSLAADSPSSSVLAGASNVILSKFTLKANNEDIKINYLRINPTASEDFKNGKLLWNGNQVGSTDLIVSTTTANIFTVNQVIPAGTTVTITYQADIINNRTNTALSGTILASLNASNVDDAVGQVSLSDIAVTSVTGKILDINPIGNLTITANTFDAAQLVMGSTENTIGSFNFNASTSSEAINVSIIKVHGNANTSSFSNVKFYDGPTLLGTVSSFDGSGNATLNLASNWVVAKGITKVLTVKADINDSTIAVSGVACAFSIVDNNSITSVGASSGSSITETLGTVTGITATPVKTKLTISKSASSPSGAAAAMAGQTVAIFSFTNSTNVAQQAATVTDLALNISTSGTWTQWSVQATKSIAVYKNSANGTLLGTSAKQGAPISVPASTGWGGATLTDFNIPSGTTVDIYIVVDTSNAPATTGKLTASIASDGVTWSDGTTEGNNMTTVNSLPVIGGTLSY